MNLYNIEEPRDRQEFMYKLSLLLPGNESIIQFLEGNIIIYDKATLYSNVIPFHFGKIKWTSFLKQFNNIIWNTYIIIN